MSNAALIPDNETIARWYDGKDFSCDWTTGNIPVWANILHEHRHRAVRVLEIGSWEGRSALFFLNYLPKAYIVCIDPFAGNVEHQQNEYFARLVPATEGRFDRKRDGAVRQARREDQGRVRNHRTAACHRGPAIRHCLYRW